MHGKYKTNVEPKLFLVECWARDGLTDEQIAKNLGIGYSTINLYKTQYVELVEALKKGKEVIDFEIENALVKRALGYKYTETTKEVVADRDDKGNIIGSHLEVTKTVTKEVAPDVTAQIYWLKNRKPGQWRDRPTEEDREALNKLDGILSGIGRMMQND